MRTIKGYRHCVICDKTILPDEEITMTEQGKIYHRGCYEVIENEVDS